MSYMQKKATHGGKLVSGDCLSSSTIGPRSLGSYEMVKNVLNYIHWLHFAKAFD